MRSEKVLILAEASFTKKQKKKGIKAELSIIERVLEILGVDSGRYSVNRLPQGGVDRYLDCENFGRDLEGRSWLSRFGKIVVVLDADKIREGARLERLKVARDNFQSKVCYLVAWENPEEFMKKCLKDDHSEKYKAKLLTSKSLANSEFAKYLDERKTKKHPFTKALSSALNCDCPEPSV